MTTESVAKTMWRLLYRAVVGPNKRPARLQQPDSEASSATSVVAELEAHYGSPKAAAAVAGVPRSTWSFWKAGKRTPKQARLEQLRSTVRRSRVPQIREKWLRRSEQDGSHIGIDLIFKVSNDERHRKIIVTNWREIPESHGMQGRIMDAFFAMDRDRAVEEIEDVLQAGVNGDTHISEVFNIRWFKTRAEALRWQRI